MTIKDVSQKSGFSVATISRVLNNDDKVSDITRAKVLETIAELNYVPNLQGRNLRRAKTELIYVLLPSIDNPFFAGIVLGIESAAREVDYRIAIFETHGRQKRFLDCVDAVKNKLVDGLIYVSPESTAMPSDTEIPIVICGESSDNFKHLTVDIDNQKAAFDAVSYLISRGRKRIAYAGGAYTSGILRKTGYLEALKKAGLDANENLIIDNSYTYDDGILAAKKILASGDKFDALFAASDLIAIGFIRQLESVGLKVPDDVAVVGFDNVEYAEMNNPPLSTVLQPRFEMGKEAFMLLYNTLNGTEKRTSCRILLEHKIIERKST